MLDVGMKVRTAMNPAALERRAKTAKRKALTRAAAFVRRSARTNPTGVTRAKKSAPPGRPYRSHDRRSRDIRFDVAEDSAVIGPVKYNIRRPDVQLGPQTAPEVGEFGGAAVLVQRPVKTKKGKTGWILAGRSGRRPPNSIRGPAAERRVKRHQFAARPVMGPSLEANVKEIPEGFVGTFGPG